MLKNKIARWLNDEVVDKVGVTAINKSADALQAVKRAAGAYPVSTTMGVDGLLSSPAIASSRVLWDVPWDDVRKVALRSGKSAGIGAGIDVLFGLYKAVSFYKEGRIDRVTAVKVVLNETAAGAASGAAGTAATVTMYLITGSYGTAALLGGMGGAIGGRWLYRKISKDPLEPILRQEEEARQQETEEEINDLMDEVNDLLNPDDSW